jgi:hypothetical protein
MDEYKKNKIYLKHYIAGVPLKVVYLKNFKRFPQHYMKRKKNIKQEDLMIE